MKKRMIFAMAAIMTLGLAGCSKDGGGAPIAGAEGTEAQMRLSFELPNAATKAVDGSSLTGTTAESTVNTFDVFIFTTTGDASASGAYTHYALPGGFTNVGGVYTAATTIETLSGDKLIYVGVNLPTALQVQQPNEAALLAKVAAVGDMDESGNFTMFSLATPATLEAYNYASGTEDTPYENSVTVNVDRVVAKIVASSSAATYTSVWPEGSADPYLTMVYTIYGFRPMQDAINLIWLPISGLWAARPRPMSTVRFLRRPTCSIPLRRMPPPIR